MKHHSGDHGKSHMAKKAMQGSRKSHNMDQMYAGMSQAASQAGAAAPPPAADPMAGPGSMPMGGMPGGPGAPC